MTRPATIGATTTGTVDLIPRPAVRRAGRVVAAAAALGLGGQLLFHGVGLGINLPIAITLLLVTGWLLRSHRRRPRLRDAWLGFAATAFASFVAIRADPAIVALDVMAALALAGMALASFGGRRVVDRGMALLLGLAVGAVGWLLTGAVAVLADARRERPAAGTLRRQVEPLLPVLRGLAIALPLVILFVALFASADAVVARIVGDIVGVDLSFGDLPGRLVLATALAWLAAGSLGLSASRGVTEPAPTSTGQPAGRLDPTEALTILAAINTVFLAFVGLQAAYLFGGLDTLAASGITYAEYARRGFFELVAVAALAGGLVVALERLSKQRTSLLVVGSIILAALTGVVLASAALRLSLYQGAFGWTELRLYVLATIILLAVGLASLIAALATDRVRWIGHALLGASLVIGFGLNVLGPVRFITEQNVARLEDPGLVPPDGSPGLDASYVASLGDDAIPALVEAESLLDEPAALHLRAELRVRLEELRASGDLGAWQAWNAGRSAAFDALRAAEEQGQLAGP